LLRFFCAEDCKGFNVQTNVEVLRHRALDALARHNAQAEVLDGATLLWIRNPSNPQLDVCDAAHIEGHDLPTRMIQ
jgi:hypothetical protein